MSAMTKYSLEEIEEVADALGELEKIIAPLLVEINYEGIGERDAEEFKKHLCIASDALKCFALMIRIFRM